MSRMSGLVREESRGRYFSLHHCIMGAGALLPLMGGGYFLDVWKNSHPQGELIAFRLLFFLAVLCGGVEWLIQARIYEPLMHSGARGSRSDATSSGRGGMRISAA